MMGRLTSWTGDHGRITSDGGREIYCHGADWPRAVPPHVGARVSFEIADGDLPQGACARAIFVVFAGDENG